MKTFVVRETQRGIHGTVRHVASGHTAALRSSQLLHRLATAHDTGHRRPGQLTLDGVPARVRATGP